MIPLSTSIVCALFALHRGKALAINDLLQIVRAASRAGARWIDQDARSDAARSSARCSARDFPELVGNA